MPLEGLAAYLTSPSIEIATGGAQLVMVSVTHLNGFTGDVLLVVDAVPEGMRAESSAMETTDGVSSALLAISAPATVAAGSYPVTVRAIGFGVPDASVPLTIVVSPSGTPVYTLEARPVSAYQGTSTAVRASIDRGVNTKNKPVTLTVTGAPNGVGVTLYPETNDAAVSTMTVTVAASVPVGQYTITLRGVSVGLADRVANIPLTVLPKF